MINENQEIDVSKENQGESNGCTFLDSSKAALKSKATVFGWEKLQDKQEDVFCVDICQRKTLSCLYPTAKVKSDSIIFAMLPKVRTNTNDDTPLIAMKVVKHNQKWLKMPPNVK